MLIESRLPGDLQKRDFARAARLGDVVDAQTRRRSSPPPGTIQSVMRRSSFSVIIVFRQRPHIRALHREQDVVMRLDVVRARVRRIGDEGDRLRRARVAHVDDGKSVAEHVADKGVPFASMTCVPSGRPP